MMFKCASNLNSTAWKDLEAIVWKDDQFPYDLDSCTSTFVMLYLANSQDINIHQHQEYISYAYTTIK